MVSVCYRKFGLIKIGHKWFYERQEDEKGGLAIYHGIPSEHSNYFDKSSISKKQYTLITELHQTKEQLYSKIRKNVRYEIRRCEKEHLKTAVFTSKEFLKEKELQREFQKVYNNMYRSKGMNKKYNEKLLKQYMNKQAILFTVGYIQDEPMIFHSYIYDDKNARFFYSASPFRENKDIAKTIAYMNKYMHWQEILYFKEKGLSVYDWGGISDPDEPNGIDNFKLAFGGDICSYENITVCRGIVGRIYKFLKTR